MKLRLRSATIQRIVVAACASSLAALALIVWSLLDPAPLAVIAAMSAGQALGTASLALYIVAILADLRRAHVLDTATEVERAREAGELPPTSLPPPSSEPKRD